MKERKLTLDRCQAYLTFLGLSLTKAQRQEKTTQISNHDKLKSLICFCWKSFDSIFQPSFHNGGQTGIFMATYFSTKSEIYFTFHGFSKKYFRSILFNIDSILSSFIQLFLSQFQTIFPCLIHNLQDSINLEILGNFPLKFSRILKVCRKL